jgi:hypothetical protein
MFGWLFGKRRKQEGSGQKPAGVPADPEAVVRLQRDYWTYAPGEQAALQGRGWEQLTWLQRLRLHHLNCMEVLEQDPFRRELHEDSAVTAEEAATPTEAPQRCRETAERLLAPDSPYRPRGGTVWQREPSPLDQRPPDLEGTLSNASLTHLGCLEVLRLDGQMRPGEVAFVPFDDVRSVGLAPPKLFRAGRLCYEDGRPDEDVFVPLLYGLSWHTDNEFYRSGRLTRFVAYPGGEGLAAGYGIGLGQQDLVLRGRGRHTLFGLGSVAQLAFALEVSDPRFDLKCRVRGLDPDAARRRTSSAS